MLALLAPLLGSLLGPYPAALAGSVTTEAGLEYDSNANRAPSDGSLLDPESCTSMDPVVCQTNPASWQPVYPLGGLLARALGTGQLQYAKGRQRLSLKLSAGGKVFFTPEVTDQTIGVVQLSYEHGAQFTRARLTAIVDYYESFQAPAHTVVRRDLRAVTAGGRLLGKRPVGEGHRVEGALDLTLQGFFYKPSPTYSFLGPSAAARLNTVLHAGDPELGHDFDLGVSVRVDYRSYTSAREAYYLQGGLTAAWQGPILLQLGYMAQILFSNVPEESYQRHLGLAKLAVRVPGDLYITLKGQLSIIDNAPNISGLYIPPGSIDDDVRNLVTVVADIERPLPRGFALLARYTGYYGLLVNGSAPYDRHTVFGGFSYTFRRTQKPQ